MKKAVKKISKKLRKNTAKGTRVYFWFIEENSVLRGAYGTFEGYAPGGLAKCHFEHSNIEVHTILAAVEIV